MSVRQSLSLKQNHVNHPTDFYDYFAPLWESLFPDLKEDSDHLAEDLLLPICERFNCRRIIDVGCGTGYDLKALREISRRKKPDPSLRLSGFDVSKAMVDQARTKADDIAFAGGIEWDVASDGFPDLIGGPKGRGLGGHEQFDAVLCLGNAICHVPPNRLEIAFRNMSLLLKKDGVLVLEFRDGDRLRAHIKNSPRRYRNAKGHEFTAAYEQRGIVPGERGQLIASFFRYLYLDDDLFTINTYFIEFADDSGYHKLTRKTKADVTRVRSMNVAYVRPDRIMEELNRVHFDVRQVSDYESVLKYGTIFVAKKR